ncbi:MAG: hypothetical protein HOC23_16375 [Halieaceae bacterium]|jgi:hypothetical protein|nr:hypothetical protein [Halieaceae bacterium]
MRASVLTVVFASLLIRNSWAEIPRTVDGKPDLNGHYDVATLTPVQRPEAFGDKLYLTRAEADKIAADEKAMFAVGATQLSPDRKAPPVGGDGSRGPAGNVGGYDGFWIDRGEDSFEIDGKIRTSIINNPANGRYPEMTAAGQSRKQKRYQRYRTNTGTAWWLELDGPGPYDNPESRSNSDRCLAGFGSTGGPPMLPTTYNNVKRIVQTPTHVMILIEMVHDARIIRLNSEHVSSDIRKWMGDSIGHWEGDTLVVDTTNFTDSPGLYFSTRNLHVVERFTRVDENTLNYSFTVDDPNTWTQPFSGEYPWPATDQPVYEYACHEANYAMGNTLRGARLLEAEAAAEKGEQ